jgi:hypothetical protein
VQHSNTPETLYAYSAFLKSQNRNDEARDWAQQLLQKKRTLPRYWQRIERPWFRKGEALLKELSVSRGQAGSPATPIYFFRVSFSSVSSSRASCSA